MCFFFLFLYLNVILHHCAETDATSITTSQGNHKSLTLKVKNKKFVEDIKHELTNNNDDYLESSPLTPSPPRATLLSTRYDRRRFLNANNTTNRTYLSPSPPKEIKDESSYSIEINTVTSQEKISIDARELRTSTFGSSVDTATTRKKKRRKPRNFKSSDLLNSLLKDPSITGVRVSGAPSPEPVRPVMRARLALSREKVPDSRQLDMAPAQGGRIETMRFKNRLCQRNVLMPEGPKYDSRGRVYLAAYAARGPAADYARTRPRRLVLPRCCNCCRKSVLGCE